MRVKGVQQFTSLDPIDIKERAAGDLDRERKRLQIIK